MVVCYRMALAGYSDAMDATIYAIVLHPALHDLLQSPVERLF